jgi:hypothetical protein
MKVRPNYLVVLGMLLVLALLVSACRPAFQTPPPSQFTGGESPTATTDSGSEPVTGSETEEGGAEELPTETTGDSRIPEDVPLPEGYYDENISRDGGQLVFKVAGTASDVVSFYQELLPQYGWELSASQDTSVGNTALLYRTNEQGDRLSINMQYNPNAQFTVVTLVVTRGAH